MLSLWVTCFFTGVGCAARGTAPPVIKSVGPPPSRADDDTLRIASVNLWGVAAFGFDFADDIDERFAAMAERLGANEPMLDVVLLQEAWKNKARRALLRHEGVMRNFPYRVDIAEQPGGAGLVILSRLPIEEAHFHRFKAQGRCLKVREGDCISGKGILTVRLTLGERSVWLANTHLIACYTQDDEPKTTCDMQDPNGPYRWDQVIEARQATEDLLAMDPAIFAGDFNFTRTSRYYPLMTSPVIAPDSSGNPPQLFTTDNKRGWADVKDEVFDANRLDYFWTRSGTELRWHALEKVQAIFTQPVVLRSGKEVPISNHPALMATLCLVQVDDPDNRCLSFHAKKRPG